MRVSKQSSEKSVSRLSALELATACRWCPRPESNRHAFRMAADFKSAVYTFFITRAGGPPVRRTRYPYDVPTVSNHAWARGPIASRILAQQASGHSMRKGSERPSPDVHPRLCTDIRTPALPLTAALRWTMPYSESSAGAVIRGGSEARRPRCPLSGNAGGRTPRLPVVRPARPGAAQVESDRGKRQRRRPEAVSQMWLTRTGRAILQALCLPLTS
jgi:hypothetical protein